MAGQLLVTVLLCAAVIVPAVRRSRPPVRAVGIGGCAAAFLAAAAVCAQEISTAADRARDVAHAEQQITRALARQPLPAGSMPAGTEARHVRWSPDGQVTLHRVLGRDHLPVYAVRVQGLITLRSDRRAAINAANMYARRAARPTR